MIVIRKGGLRMGTLLLMIIQIALMTITILWNVVRLIKTRECRKSCDHCTNMRCIWRDFCSKYDRTREITYYRVVHLHDMMIFQKKEES